MTLLNTSISLKHLFGSLLMASLARVNDQAPMTKDSLFRIYSMSKPVSGHRAHARSAPAAARVCVASAMLFTALECR